MSGGTRLAVVPVRDGALPLGGAEAVAAVGGRTLLVGEGASAAAVPLAGIATEVRAWDVRGYAPGAWAAALAPLLVDEQVVLLPASPDGRDLAPRIAALLDRPVLAGAVEVRDDRVSTAVWGGSLLADHPARDPVVVTLQPGTRGVEPPSGEAPKVEVLELELPDVEDVEVLEVLPPDVSTMDLAEAPRIFGGGAGLDSPERFEQLQRVAAGIGAAVGATRVVTDRGWLPHTRQIGTTGVVVAPNLYVALGISGAVQHTAGLGDPEHVISVNTDPHCPMMGMADLAVVADANATIAELERLLDDSTREGSGG